MCHDIVDRESGLTNGCCLVQHKCIGAMGMLNDILYVTANTHGPGIEDEGLPHPTDAQWRDVLVTPWHIPSCKFCAAVNTTEPASDAIPWQPSFASGHCSQSEAGLLCYSAAVMITMCTAASDSAAPRQASGNLSKSQKQLAAKTYRQLLIRMRNLLVERGRLIKMLQVICFPLACSASSCLHAGRPCLPGAEHSSSAIMCIRCCFAADSRESSDPAQRRMLRDAFIRHMALDKLSICP